MDIDNIENQLPITELIEKLTGADLNERIISLAIFRCSLCQKFLNSPIMLVSGIGNVCGSCAQQNNINETAIHNSALETILQNLAIPCSNVGRGCKSRLEYCNRGAHESVCTKRSSFCPIKITEECNWEGHSSMLLNHCLEKHSNSVLSSIDNCFKIDVNISLSNEIVKLLQFENYQFIVHIKCDIDDHRLQFIIYYFGSADKVSDFSFTIEQIGTNACTLYHGKEMHIFHDSEFTNCMDQTKTTNFDLSFLKQMVSSSVVTTIIKILKASSHYELDETLVTLFECPVCNNYMKPPIFQCVSGHSLCSSCRGRIGQCPTCRSCFGDTRNYVLEALSNNVQFPCKYRDLGCLYVLPSTEIKNHEDQCPLKAYNCPLFELSRCDWKGTQSAILNHLKANHADKIKFTNFNKVHITTSCNSNFTDLYFMVAYDEIFRICYKRDLANHNLHWSVQLVGPKGEAKKYKYEIGLIDYRNEHRTLIRTDVCQDLTDYNKTYSPYIKIPSNISTWFSYNGHITYFCKIIKVYVRV